MSDWPELTVERDHDTLTILHLAAQMLGKMRVAHAPWVNHGWHSALQPDATGFVTLPTAASDGRSFTLALDPTVTTELRHEGIAREVVNRVQKLRKDTGLEVSDRIRLGVFGDGELLDAMRGFGELVRRETLAVELEVGSATDYHGYEADREVDLDGVPATIALARIATGS